MKTRHNFTMSHQSIAIFTCLLLFFFVVHESFGFYFILFLFFSQSSGIYSRDKCLQIYPLIEA